MKKTIYFIIESDVQVSLIKNTFKFDSSEKRYGRCNYKEK